MSQNEIISLLNDLISQEEMRLINSCPKDEQGRKVILFALMRGFDTYHLFTKGKDKYSLHYEFGWLRSLGLAHGNFVNEPQYPFFKADEKLLGFAHWFVVSAGDLEFCRKTVDFIKAGLCAASVNDKQIIAEFRNIGIKEEFDNKAYRWVHDMVDKKFCEPQINNILKEIEDVRKLMRPLVDKWRTHSIQYDTTPEIDNVFEKFSYYRLFSSEEKEEFNQDALFGGVPYSKYCEFVMVVNGIALKHYYFCLELAEKYKGEVSLADIITITKDRRQFIETMARHIDISIADSEKIVDSITLLPENVEYHSKLSRPAPPPYVKIADNTLIRSIVGCQVNPYSFMNRELRRKYEKDYFNAVNQREKTFRDQLYGLFTDDNFVKVSNNVMFQSSKGSSDIDAAVYDKSSNVLGLFQLKWQEKYGASMKERYSRVSNLYPKASEWIDKVEAWISESSIRDAMKKFGIEYSSDEPVKVLLFVVCRHGTFFTGYEPDKRATWSSIWQVMRAFSQMPENIPNKLEALHNFLYQEYILSTKEKQTPDEDVFNIGEYEVRLKSLS